MNATDSPHVRLPALAAPLQIGSAHSLSKSSGHLDKSAVLQLAHAEYRDKVTRGEPVDPDQFCERFPAYKSSLQRLLELDCFFEDNSGFLADIKPTVWPEPGQPLLGFQLLEELGRGSFARVFLATDTTLGNRRVALKISPVGGNEADTLGRLGHP